MSAKTAIRLPKIYNYATAEQKIDTKLRDSFRHFLKKTHAALILNFQTPIMGSYFEKFELPDEHDDWKLACSFKTANKGSRLGIIFYTNDTGKIKLRLYEWNKSWESGSRTFLDKPKVNYFNFNGLEQFKKVASVIDVWWSSPQRIAQSLETLSEFIKEYIK